MPCVWKKSVNDFSLTNFKETIRFFFQSSFSACSFPLSILCLQRYKWGSLSLTVPVARVLTHSSVNTEGRADRCHLLASLSQVLTTLISNSTVNLQVAWKLDSTPPFVNTITVFCANICFIKFNIRVLKNAAYSLIYLKMHIKCANVPNSTPFKSCYRLLGFTMRNLGAYHGRHWMSSRALEGWSWQKSSTAQEAEEHTALSVDMSLALEFTTAAYMWNDFTRIQN